MGIIIIHIGIILILGVLILLFDKNGSGNLFYISSMLALSSQLLGIILCFLKMPQPILLIVGFLSIPIWWGYKAFAPNSCCIEAKIN
jgi:hypothetical protein